MSTGTTCCCSNPDCRKHGCIIYNNMRATQPIGIVSTMLVHVLRTLTDEEARLLAFEIQKRLGKYEA